MVLGHLRDCSGRLGSYLVTGSRDVADDGGEYTKVDAEGRSRRKRGLCILICYLMLCANL